MRADALHMADIAHMVHQQTDLDAHGREGAVLIAQGDGVHVVDSQGRRYIEAMAGLWCASLVFSEKRLADAAYRQLLQLPYYHTFFQKEHEPSVRLAEKLVELMADKAARTPFPPARKAGVLVQNKCHEAGLIVRAIGDRIAFTPRRSSRRPGSRRWAAASARDWTRPG